MWKLIKNKDADSSWTKSGAGILFTDGNKILLLKRSNSEEDAQGTWACAGGKSNDGESLEQTAKREVTEELGSFPECKKLGYFDMVEDGFLFRTYIAHTPEPFECEIDDEHDAYNWFSFDNAKKLNLHPGLSQIFDQIIDVIKTKLNHKHETRFKEWLDSFFFD